MFLHLLGIHKKKMEAMNESAWWIKCSYIKDGRNRIQFHHRSYHIHIVTSPHIQSPSQSCTKCLGSEAINIKQLRLHLLGAFFFAFLFFASCGCRWWWLCADQVVEEIGRRHFCGARPSLESICRQAQVQRKKKITSLMEVEQFSLLSEDCHPNELELDRI